MRTRAGRAILSARRSKGRRRLSAWPALVLPPSARLSRRAQFAEVVRRGSRAGTPTLVAHLIVTPGAGSDGPRRAGFVVSRSVGPAV